VLLDRGDGALDPRIGGGEEAEVRDDQHARVHGVAAVGLGEGIHPGVEPALADLLVDALAQRAQVGQRSRARSLPGVSSSMR
jgi:hypothetical protein